MRTLSVLCKRHKILSLPSLLIFVVIFGCGCGDGGSGLDFTGQDNRTPIGIKLVHRTLFVVTAVVNNAENLDMLVDTGSSRTHVPADIFKNSDIDRRKRSALQKTDLDIVKQLLNFFDKSFDIIHGCVRMHKDES
jgi:hypothetical protein